MYDVYVIGGLVLDLYGEFDRYPEEGEEVFSPSSSLSIGGTAYNIANGFLYNGINPVLSAYIGDDLIGQLIEDNLKKKDIKTSIVKVKDVGTGIIFSVLTPNNRTMFTYRGADGLFSFTDEMVDIARNSKITVISSYVFMGKEELEGIMSFLDSVKKHTKIALSVAKSVLDTRFAWILEVLDKVDLLFLNKVEYSILANYISTDKEVIVTMDKDGAKYLKNDDTIFVPQFDKVNRGRFVGAGDVFCAGFLSGMLKGLSIEDSLALGNNTSLSWILYQF